MTAPTLSHRSDDLDAPIWGAEAIGEHIRRNKRQTFHLLETGKLDATKVGQLWTSTKRRLNRSLGNG
jgi:hypothetical protein